MNSLGLNCLGVETWCIMTILNCASSNSVTYLATLQVQLG